MGEAKKNFGEHRVSFELKDAVKVSDPKPPPPFPVAKKKKTKAKQENQEYLRFVKMLKEVNLNISAYDIFTGTPKYVKFFKNMLANRKETVDDEVVELSKICSAILKKDLVLPQKLKDPGSYTIPCQFGEMSTYKALCDLGSGVS